MTFDPQPTLTGELLELRPLRQDDWPALFAVASDPLIWEQHPEADRYREDVFRTFFANAMDSGGALVAIDRATGAVIGSSRFHNFNPGDHARAGHGRGWSRWGRLCDYRGSICEHAEKRPGPLTRAAGR